ncbi:MAG: HD domain-containing protein [Pseudobutyrivibrio sp.]|nr:HD domain-containing protein [Pseudobutyrivibrio sp.]
MSFTIHSIMEILKSKESTADTVLSDGEINIEAYYLKSTSSINVNFLEEDILAKSECHYILLEGEAEVSLPLERTYLKAGDVYSEYNFRKFNIYAITDCKLIAVNNMPSNGINTHHNSLTEAIRQVEDADKYLKGHNARVGKYTGAILRGLQPNIDWSMAMLAASFHDVGKLVIPMDILNKPGKLTPEEFEYIKKHPAATYELLQGAVSDEVAKLARWHHEKLDGSGYPDGIKGDEIPLPSRAMAVADIFDAITTSRIYRDAKSFDEALKVLHAEVKEGKLDEDCVNMLEKSIELGVIKEGVDNEILHFEEE